MLLVFGLVASTIGLVVSVYSRRSAFLAVVDVSLRASCIRVDATLAAEHPVHLSSIGLHCAVLLPHCAGAIPYAYSPRELL